jgi:glutathionylspermidine synthase
VLAILVPLDPISLGKQTSDRSKRTKKGQIAFGIAAIRAAQGGTSSELKAILGLALFEEALARLELCMPPQREYCMRRENTRPRPHWRTEVEKLGLVFHHTEGRLYWDESVFYRLTLPQVDVLEDATNELSRLFIEALEYVVKNDLFLRLSIPPEAIPIVKWSWENREPALYGRVDLAYDGINPPKLLEYNADTPTALLEASVVQWLWLQEKFPQADQFNSIHERLVSTWAKLKGRLNSLVYFGYMDSGTGEDLMTITYLRDTAEEAGIRTKEIEMPDIGWNSGRGFVDLDENKITSIFKLYPWEWMLAEGFAAHLLEIYRQMNWIEPIWKMVLSNKGVLPLMWELNPGHPNLLEAYAGRPGTLHEYVRKPLLSREGSNIRLQTRERVIETSGPYGKEGYIYQAVASLPSLDGWYPVIGSWIIDGEAAGIGVRESATPITDHREKFVPHIIG